MLYVIRWERRYLSLKKIYLYGVYLISSAVENTVKFTDVKLKE